MSRGLAKSRSPQLETLATHMNRIGMVVAADAEQGAAPDPAGIQSFWSSWLPAPAGQVSGSLALVGIRILPVTGVLVSLALIVAVMQAHGLTHLASHDADFDRVPGITRIAPA